MPWPELALAAVSAVILLQAVKMSPQEVQQELLSKAAILPLLCHLPLGSRLRLYPQFQVLPRSCANSSWRVIQLPSSCWKRITDLALANSLSKLGSPTSIMGTCTWTATAFVSSVRITLTMPEPAGPNASYLPPRFSVGQSYRVGTNIKITLKGPQWQGPNSRASSEKTWEMIGLLLTTSVVNLDEILNIKPNLCWIELLT